MAKRSSSRSSSGSSGEAFLLLQIRAARLPEPVQQYRFASDIKRKWSFDFAWPETHVALEIEGGTWITGRHNRGAGFANDCEKYNRAALRGWTVLRVTTEMVDDGTALKLLEEVFCR